MAKKLCSKCLIEKDETEFHKNKHGKFGRHSWCKVCFNSYHPAHRTPEKFEDMRDRNFKYKYGISLAEVNAMLEEQGGKCALCSNELKKFHLDHNHKTGKNRGLLCHRCNIRIGGWDDKEFAERALKYLGITPSFG